MNFSILSRMNFSLLSLSSLSRAWAGLRSGVLALAHTRHLAYPGTRTVTVVESLNLESAESVRAGVGEMACVELFRRKRSSCALGLAGMLASRRDRVRASREGECAALSDYYFRLREELL